MKNDEIDGKMKQETPKQKCGFVALVGATNAGKSTLVNHLTGHKVSIVSRKVQTTRTRVVGIAMHDKDDVRAQLIFIDTPGLFEPKKRLDRAMIAAAEGAMQEADHTLLLVDVSKPPHVVQEEVIKGHNRIKKMAPEQRIALVFNKIDKIARDKLLELSQAASEACDFEAIFMISALNGAGVNEVLDFCTDKAQDTVWMYPEDEISTMPFRLMAAEVTREVVMDQVHQEIPYAMTVVTDHIEKFDNGDYKLMQSILVEKDSQKVVLIGAGGAKIKKIGTQARREMGNVFDGKIHLNLVVRVNKKWQSDPEYYALWNLEGQQ